MMSRQELAVNSLHLMDGIKIKPKHLVRPTTFPDFGREDERPKCWKRARRHQYRAN